MQKGSNKGLFWVNVSKDLDSVVLVWLQGIMAVVLCTVGSQRPRI